MMPLVFYTPGSNYISDEVVPGSNPPIGKWSGKPADPDARLMTADEARRAIRDAAREPAREIDEAQFWDWLEVLPPCRWHRTKHAECFHISERINLDVVQWVGRIGTRYFTLADIESLPADRILAAGREVLK